ncbi:hypothetical protein HYDPIDRAFT_123078 [Hydnomerulius pinastri MD-312]|nr:hypothetical protein HYDPIDRAFT_123078 [Hydnomerulius pinastri MD-312]
MPPQKPEPEDSDASTRQVNNILRNLRGEHFRHARNVQGTPASSISLAAHAHNQPTLPISLIYPSPAPNATGSNRAQPTRSTWIAGPSPPRSWRSPASASVSEASRSRDTTEFKADTENDTNSAAWRERALSLVFSPDITSSPSSAESTHLRAALHPDQGTAPPLTLICLRLILAACPGSDLVEIIPYIPAHLRRALLRYTAVHAPLSQVVLDALCDVNGHVDGELIIVGPRASLHRNAFRKESAIVPASNDESTNEGGSDSQSWDSAPIQDTDPPPLFSLSLLSTLLSVPTFLALPPTITHLALLNIPFQVPLQRLPTICPLLVLLDLSYNSWLSPKAGPRILEEVGWGRLRRLEVLGLRGCLVTSKLLVEVNRGRWEDVKVIRYDGT